MSDTNSNNDSIYKLSTGEKLSIPELEKLIGEKCHYVQFVSAGKDADNNPVAFIFPNQKQLNHPDYKVSPEQGCFCPRNLNELGRCLSGCIHQVNKAIQDDDSKVNAAAILNRGVPKENGANASFQTIYNKYKALLHETHGEVVPPEEEIYLIKNAL